MLHKLTDYCKRATNGISRTLVDSYNRYLKNNNIMINSKISSDMLFGFDMQGEVRTKIEDNPIKSDEFLKEFYPPEINSATYRERVQRELNKIFNYLEEKFEIESLAKNLGKVKLENINEESIESLVFTGNVNPDKSKSADLGNVVSSIDNIIEELHTISENPMLTIEDKKELKTIENQLIEFSKKFILRKKNVDFENQVIAVFKTVLAKFKSDYERVTSDSHKKLSTYKESIKRAEDNIVDIVLRYQKNKHPTIEFDTIDIDIQTYKIYNYEFHSRLNLLSITQEYIWNFFKKAFKKETKTFILDMSQKELSDALLRYGGSEAEALNELKQSISKMLDEDFKPKYTITEAGQDKTEELGKNNEGKFIVQSGALEYHDENYSMLDIISLHIEGGLETLQRRWKRYKKNNRISSS